jgi:diguanylate cyclase (GGDEF)-like protein
MVGHALTLDGCASRLAPLREALIGRDPQLSAGVRRMLPTLVMFGICAVLLMLGASHGLGTRWKAGLLSGYLAVIWLLPYALLRSGRTRHLDDPLLTYPTLLLNISAVVLAYGLLDEARGAPLQVLSLLLAVQMARLPHRRVLGASLITLGMLATALAVVWLVNPASVNLRDELLNFFMLMAMLPACALVSREVQRTRARQSAQQAELACTLAQLRELSTHDPLTGLSNRRHMMALLDEEIRRQRRSGAPLCVAVLDLDHFKRVNDEHGHAAGDAVLQRFATLVRGVLPPTATLARWGGEEFLLLLPDTTAAHAAEVLAAARQALHDCDWSTLGRGLRVTCSIGLAAHAIDASSMQTLESADLALYRAKHAGRDCAFCGEINLNDVAAHARPPQVSTHAAPAAEPHDQAAASADAGLAAPHRLRYHSPNAPTDAAAAPAASAEPDAPRGALARLYQLLMGHRPEMRDSLQLTVAGSTIYLIWIAVINGYAVPRGLVWPAYRQPLLAIDLIGALCFYPLIRSGLTARWRDPELSLPQILWGCLAAMAAYVAIPDLRPSTMQAMCLIQIFGMVTLSPRASLQAGAFSLALVLAALLLLGSHQMLPTRELHAETLKMVMAGVVLVQLTRLSHRFSLVRQQVERDRAALASAVEQVRDQAIRDPLTGLYNRRHLLERLERERQRAVHLQRPFCVALLDLDHFKRVNDTYGHAVGDEVLCGLAHTLRSVMRESDVLGRWGGEEFLVLLPDTHANEGVTALNRLRRHLGARALADSAPHLRTTLSAGVAMHTVHETLEQVIERADRALYTAKSAGRDRCLAAP